MVFKILIQIFILISLGLIGDGSDQLTTISPTTRHTGPISYGCINCLQSKNMACIDGNCYCKTNYYWNQDIQQCQFMYCSNTTMCQVPQDPIRYCFNLYCICQFPYVEDPTNGYKCTQRTIPTHPTIPSAATPSPTITTVTTIPTTERPEQTTASQDPFVVYNNCSNCLYYNNLVCIDQKCYCAPNYQWDPINKNCRYVQCYTDADCYQSKDINRYCDPWGRCLCLRNYKEDWSNGRLCTFHLSIWYWVWIFILLPVVGLGVGIWLCIRKRKRSVQAQSLVAQEQPPAYGTQFTQNQYPNRVPTIK